MNEEQNIIEPQQPAFLQGVVMPRYFVPHSQLFHLTIGKKYLITYTKDGRQIKDDKGVERIVKPLPYEIEGEVQK